MLITKTKAEECCKKPAVTFHMKDNYTLSVAAVAIVAGIVVLHICMCKMSCKRKNKIKMLKKEAKELDEKAVAEQ